ncbi:hypothetical protein [Inhella sp.]|uniref:hypothetical protein n=1 Tax=Inhella sp. TaxID=1921806 RepID=UPI0035B04EAF
MTEVHYLRWVRASALYDLIVTWPLATPWTLSLLLAQMAALHQQLGLPGQLPVPDALHLLLGSLLGSLVLVWAGLRVWRPSVLLGRLDLLTRVAFLSWELWAAAQGLSPLLLGFAFFEALFGVAQAWPLRQPALKSGCSDAAVPRCPAASRS